MYAEWFSCGGFRQSHLGRRDGLHPLLFPQIDNFMGKGLELEIQPERATAMIASHLPNPFGLDNF